MINRFFLYLTLLPSPLYKKMGVNIPQLKAILDAKLKMDDRRPSGVRLGKEKEKKKEISKATLGTMFMMAILGLLFITSFFSSNITITQFSIYYSFFIFILASTLISDFTIVLIDVRDNYIILPKPVSDRTFLMSRLLHIFIHISKLVLPLNLPTMITLVITKSALALIPFLIILPFVTLFTIFLINAIYLIILKFTTPNKFKTIISYFQIVFAIAIYGGYQIIPRILDLSVLENYHIPQNGWTLLAPPYWFACLYNLIFSYTGNTYIVTAASFGIIFPVLSVWLIVKYFAPSFNRKLGMIAGSENGEAITIKGGIQENRTEGIRLNEKLSNLFTRSGAERMGFRFTWLMTSRSRDFKIKTYPSLGYLLVMIVLVFIKVNKFSWSELKQNGSTSHFILLSSIYIIGLLVYQAMLNIKLSDKFKAAWIYQITPLEKPGPLLLGSVKALILKFYLPFATIVLLSSTWIIGISSLPNLMLGLMNQLCIILSVAYLSLNELPFSSSDMGRMKGGNFSRNLFSLILPWIIGAGHYLIYNFLPVVWILLVLSSITVWILADSLKNKGWEKIKFEG